MTAPKLKFFDDSGYEKAEVETMSLTLVMAMTRHQAETVMTPSMLVMEQTGSVAKFNRG